MQEEKGEEDPNMNGLMALLLKKEDENAMLRQKLELLENATSLNTNGTPKEISIGTTTTQVSNTQNSMNSGITATTTTSPPQMDLSNAFLEEMKSKVFEYDKSKYKEYFALANKKKKWYGLGEEDLVKLFPCFSLLVEKYKEKMFGKRSKWERKETRFLSLAIGQNMIW
jgi:hypothetical protein